MHKCCVPDMHKSEKAVIVTKKVLEDSNKMPGEREQQSHLARILHELLERHNMRVELLLVDFVIVAAERNGH